MYKAPIRNTKLIQEQLTRSPERAVDYNHVPLDAPTTRKISHTFSGEPFPLSDEDLEFLNYRHPGEPVQEPIDVDTLIKLDTGPRKPRRPSPAYPTEKEWDWDDTATSIRNWWHDIWN